MHATAVSIPLIGHPNAGKSSLLNQLSGGHLRTGNWPGVTVELSEARVKHQGKTYQLVDLPGITSLAPSPRRDEQITLDALRSTSGVLLNVVDSTDLPAQLSLTLALIRAGHNVVVVLTHSDRLQRHGGSVDDQALSERLGVPVWRFDPGSHSLPLEQLPSFAAIKLSPQATVSTLLAEAKYHAAQATSLSQRLDRIALHPRWGLALFAAVFYGLFKLTFDLSIPLVAWADGFVQTVMGRLVVDLQYLLPLPAVVQDFLLGGIIPGVGLVVSFVPLLGVLYLLLGLLEQSGYLMRANRLFRRQFEQLGLPGGALIPILLGFGCGVPAVYALRTLPDASQRRRVAGLLPFVSCSGKLPIYLFFGLVFFPQHSALVIGSLYLIGIGVLLLWARLTKPKGHMPLVSTDSVLPAFHRPRWQPLWRSTRHQVASFLHDAGSVIALSMLVIWALTRLPYGVAIEHSWLATVSRALSPLFAPLGLGADWRPVAAVLPGFVAKEVVIGTLGQLYATTPEPFTASVTQGWLPLLAEQLHALGQALFAAVGNVFGSLLPSTLQAETPMFGLSRLKASFTPLTAYVFMLFNLLLISCFANLGAIRQEFGLRFMLKTAARTLLTAYGVCLLVYQVGAL